MIGFFWLFVGIAVIAFYYIKEKGFQTFMSSIVMIGGFILTALLTVVILEKLPNENTADIVVYVVIMVVVPLCGFVLSMLVGFAINDMPNYYDSPKARRWLHNLLKNEGYEVDSDCVDALFDREIHTNRKIDKKKSGFFYYRKLCNMYSFKLEMEIASNSNITDGYDKALGISINSLPLEEGEYMQHAIGRRNNLVKDYIMKRKGLRYCPGFESGFINDTDEYAVQLFDFIKKKEQEKVNIEEEVKTPL